MSVYMWNVGALTSQEGHSVQSKCSFRTSAKHCFLPTLSLQILYDLKGETSRQIEVSKIVTYKWSAEHPQSQKQASPSPHPK